MEVFHWVASEIKDMPLFSTEYEVEDDRTGAIYNDFDRENPFHSEDETSELEFSFTKPKASAVYRDVLRTLGFLDDQSVFCSAAFSGGNLYGHSKLDAALYALFQRMRNQCVYRQVNAIIFFDEGHPEYRSLYRKSRIYLWTGSTIGTGRNLPLSMFTKDSNACNTIKPLHFYINFSNYILNT